VTAPPLRWLAASLAIGALGGLALGWQLWRPQTVTETPAPEVIQEDGSRVLERAPDPTARPAHQLPPGATLERVVRVEVRPDPLPAPVEVPRGTPDSSVAGVAAPRDTARGCSCAPVTVELSLVRLEDGTRRVVASATGGTLLGGVDIPVESAAPAKVLRWSAGAEYDLAAKGWGGYLERDFDRLAFVPLPIRLGGSFTPRNVSSGPRVGLRVGLRF
jgi:hypothetical protein